MGKRVGEWVYELCMTTLDTDRFLVEDVLDLYHGRGADRGRYSLMRISKKIQTAGAPTPSVERRLWQVAWKSGVEPAPDTGKDDAGS